MARQPMTQRLARLLALPAWVARHDGASLEEAAAHFGVTPAVIRQDVYTLWVSGLPGGMPGDLVDFDAARFEEGRLSLVEPLGLDRPVRLSRPEATSLLLAVRVLRSVLAPDAAAAEVLTSTETVLSGLLASEQPGGKEREHHDTDSPWAPGPGVNAQPAGQDRPEDPGVSHSVQVLAAVREALDRGRRLHLVYASATDTRSERDVDPVELTSDGTHLRLRGWCLSAGAERTFRLDRVLAATVLPVAARTPPSVRVTDHATDRRSCATARSLPRAVLVLRPSGRWLVEQVPCDSVQERSDGMIRAEVEGRDQAWLISLVLSCGAHLVSVEPQELLHEAVASATRALDSYRLLHSSDVSSNVTTDASGDVGEAAQQVGED
ncbi:helix-turn-helix transcriptional regulator [Actinomyces wuliandei]|uniref:helix-turn-helix transcriptional regulator n=1 Tax=Actinomyces wuliandei TaxID=2057743 RepID=UPI000FD73F5E|nr:WYL domain-containing protein [Actinomyces wuliandei]